MTSPIDHCVKIPLSKVLEIEDGAVVQCFRDRYWTVTANREILLYQGHSPQCNSNKEIATNINNKLYPDCTVEFIHMLFLPYDCE